MFFSTHSMRERETRQIMTQKMMDKEKQSKPMMTQKKKQTLQQNFIQQEQTRTTMTKISKQKSMQYVNNE